MTSRRFAAVAVALMTGAATVACSGTSMINACPATSISPPVGPSHAIGPDPTAESAAAATGPFAVTTTRVTGQTGFAGGNLYVPTNAPNGRLGGIVLAPPFLVNSLALAPMAQRLSTHGFVVLAFDANSSFDPPSARAAQTKAALGYLTTQSTASSRVDPDRLAVGGYSMGGGASLEVARDVPTLKAVLPMVPWNTTQNFSGIRIPTMIIAAEADGIAPASQHAVPFWNSLPVDIPKSYVEGDNQGHFMPTVPPASMTRYAVSWMKRWVDNDTRYTPFLSVKASDLSNFRACSVA